MAPSVPTAPVAADFPNQKAKGDDFVLFILQWANSFFESIGIYIARKA